MFTHPEKKDHELFLCNATMDSFNKIKSGGKWSYIRLGFFAYDADGKEIKASCEVRNTLYPVFVLKSEYTDDTSAHKGAM